MTKEILGLISILLTLFAYLPYLVNTLNGRLKPHPFTWLIWSTVHGIGVIAQISDNAGPGAWANFVMFSIMVMVTIASIKNGFEDIKSFDIWIFAGSFAAIPIWLITKDATYSVLIITIINYLAVALTFKKSFHKPYEESLNFFIVNLARSIVILFALENVSFITAFFPASIVLANIVMIIGLYWRRNALKKENMQ